MLPSSWALNVTVVPSVHSVSLGHWLAGSFQCLFIFGVVVTGTGAMDHSVIPVITSTQEAPGTLGDVRKPTEDIWLGCPCSVQGVCGRHKARQNDGTVHMR